MNCIPREERTEMILAIHTARRVPSVLLLVHLTVRRGDRPQRVMESCTPLSKGSGEHRKTKKNKLKLLPVAGMSRYREGKKCSVTERRFKLIEG